MPIDILRAENGGGKKYEVVFEPIEDSPKELEYKMEKLQSRANKGSYGVVGDLKRYISKFPRFPTLRNYLYVAYKRGGKDEKAVEVLKETIIDFPDYLFGRVGLASEYLSTGQYHKVSPLLGEQMELSVLYPDRDVFHFTEAMAYWYAAGWYCAVDGRMDEANEKLKKIREIDKHDPRVKDLSLKIFEHGLSGLKDRLSASERMRVKVKSFPTITYQNSTIPPKFENSEIDVFYKYSIDDLPQAEIRMIEGLNRDSLVRDLELVVKDSIIRYQWFSRHFDEFDENRQSFVIHAIYWLGALEVKESLNTVLNMFRQGEEFIEYWFGDILEENILEPLYFLAQGQLNLLKIFVLEPNLSFEVRSIASQAVEQVAHHQPNRREEVIEWYDEVLKYHIDHPNDISIIDTQFITSIIYSLAKIKAIELESLIEKAWALNWIDEFMIGNLEQIKAFLYKPINPGDKSPLPLDIGEFYNGYYNSRREERVYTKEELEENQRIIAEIKDDELMKMLLNTTDHETESAADFGSEGGEMSNFWEQTPIRRKNKIGRNDPCPCGSGKKHKKCCL